MQKRRGGFRWVLTHHKPSRCFCHAFVGSFTVYRRRAVKTTRSAMLFFQVLSFTDKKKNATVSGVSRPGLTHQERFLRASSQTVKLERKVTRCAMLFFQVLLFNDDALCDTPRAFSTSGLKKRLHYNVLAQRTEIFCIR